MNKLSLSIAAAGLIGFVSPVFAEDATGSSSSSDTQDQQHQHKDAKKKHKSHQKDETMPQERHSQPPASSTGSGGEYEPGTPAPNLPPRGGSTGNQR